VFFRLHVGVLAQQPARQKITGEERKLVERMLENVHNVLKQNYYDPSFRALDIDGRYKQYEGLIKEAESVGGAFRVVAAYLAGLNDSHTIFIPPDRNNIADYGFEMQVVGDTCYVTEVRPGADAEQKIRPGDQILSLDGYKVGRDDISQLQYYLGQIAPKPVTGMTVRSPSGEKRDVLIATKYVEHRPVPFMDFEMWRETDEWQKRRHLLRQRNVERGDVLFWKMPTFLTEGNEIDRMIQIARHHKTLVLDLRGNSGGAMPLLARLVGSVMDHDVTIGTRVMRKGQTPEVAKSRTKNLFTGNLIVVVDSRSSSATEVFARVVQLEHRGTIIGDRTSGSVMEAQYFSLQDYSGVVVEYGALITVADLIMTDGKSLEKLGVIPDVLALPVATDLAQGQDPVLAKAAELAGVKIDPAEAGTLFPFEWLGSEKPSPTRLPPIRVLKLLLDCEGLRSLAGSKRDRGKQLSISPHYIYPPS
jgi:C-terminal processing protease CtpA/Prc